MKYHKTFGRIAGLSTANVIDTLCSFTEESPFFLNRRSYAERVFGPLDKVKGSDKDLIWLAEQAAASGTDRAPVYLACGTEDMLLHGNHALRDSLVSLGFSVTYEEGPGGHEWDFWNRYIKFVLDWLPLEPPSIGISSGNIGM